MPAHPESHRLDDPSCAILRELEDGLYAMPGAEGAPGAMRAGPDRGRALDVCAPPRDAWRAPGPGFGFGFGFGGA